MENRTDDFKIFQNVKRTRSDLGINYLANQKDKPRINCGWEQFHPAWNIPALDLTPKKYHQNRTKRKYIVNSYKNNIIKQCSLPKLSYPQICKNKREEKNMITKFRVLSANTDRRETLETGYHEKEHYRQPRPHHFNDDIHRPLDDIKSLGKEDFKVSVDHDPFNIRFKNESLQQSIPELSVKLNTTRITTEPMDTKLQPTLKWDKQLLFTKEKYLEGRDPKEVFFEKIEDTLGWMSEKDTNRLCRPNIFDNHTTDWLEITRNGTRHKCQNTKTEPTYL